MKENKRQSKKMRGRIYKDTQFFTHTLPLFKGKEIRLLDKRELEEYLSTCLYCNLKVYGVDNRATHLNTYHTEEHIGAIRRHCFWILKNYALGKAMNFIPLQQEALLMATIGIIRDDMANPLNQLLTDALNNEVFFYSSIFFNALK